MEGKSDEGSAAEGGGDGGGGSSEPREHPAAAAAVAEAVVVIELTAEQLEDAQQVFSMLAPGGALLVRDLELAIGALGLFPSPEDLATIRGELDASSHNSTMDFAAFVKALSRKLGIEDFNAEAREAWSRLELAGGGSGNISLAEFRHILMLSEKMNDDEADALVKRASRRQPRAVFRFTRASPLTHTHRLFPAQAPTPRRRALSPWTTLKRWHERCGKKSTPAKNKKTQTKTGCRFSQPRTFAALPAPAALLLLLLLSLLLLLPALLSSAAAAAAAALALAQLRL